MQEQYSPSQVEQAAQDHWNRNKVSSVTADKFAADMYDEIDWSRIIDRDTEQPFTASTRAALPRA